MKDVAVADVRNFVLLGHTQSGKTTLCDTLLWKLGVNERQGAVGAGSSLADCTDEEKHRKLSIYAKFFAAPYKTRQGKKAQFVFLDTPGYDDFIGQVIAAARAADAALLTVDAAAGMQVGTAKAWRRCLALRLPRAIVVTGLDRDNTDFAKTTAEIQAVWGNACVPVTLPLPGGGVLDLLQPALPADLPEAAQAARNALIERAAETNDALLEKYLGGEALTADELAQGLRAAVRGGALVPIFAVMALKDVGVAEWMEGLYRLLPSPAERPFQDADGKPVNPAPDAPFVGWIWKTVTDPFSGKLAFLRVLGGTLTENGEVVNADKGHKERIGTLLIMNGAKKPTPTTEARAGDIVALPKLKETTLNDTLCVAGHKARSAPLVFPSPVVSFAVSAKERSDEDKIGIALARVAEDDPTLKVERQADTNELIISGMGDVHLEVANEAMKKRSNVTVELKVPKVSYRETVTGLGEGHYKHKKQSGGRGQYAEVYCKVSPRKPEEEWFEDAVVGGVIPRNFIPACEKGFVEAMKGGVQAGFPVVNIKVSVYDGSYHDVDSSEIAFKIAAARAFKEAMSKAHPVLLEPIMLVKVLVPEQYMGDINGDLNHKRGRILGVDVEDGLQAITAEVPQSEMFRYSSELRSVTGGRGSFELKFSRYDVVPGNIAQKIVAGAEKAKHDEDE